MTAITTSTASTASAFSNQRKVDRCQNGVLWAHWWDGTASTTTSMRFAYSTDNGATWTNIDANAFGFANASTSYTPNASMFIDLDDYCHVVYKDQGVGKVCYRRGTPNAGRTAWTWSASVVVADNATMNHPDIVAHRDGSGWKVHIVHTDFFPTANATHYARLSVSSGGAITTDTSQATVGSGSIIGGGYGVNASTWPSIDFNHTGDGKTVAGSTPHLYAVWSTGSTGAGNGIRFKKATYSGGSWTWGTEREIDSTSYAYSGGISSIFDGSRCVIAYADSAATSSIKVRERDAIDTTTTTRTPTALTDGAVEAISVTYDGDADVHLWAVGTTSDDVKRVEYDRSAGTWDGSWTTVAAADALADSPSLKRGYSDNSIEFIYTDGTASPYNVTYGGISLNVAPNAPTLVYPVGNQIFDRATAQIFDHTISDPDPGDSQSQFELRHRLAGAGTWAETLQFTTTSSEHTFAPNYFAAGDYEWQVRTADAQGLYGPWSASAFFTAANAPASPTIVAPTGGSTISQEASVVEWSTPTQSSYQVRKVADNAGVANTATVYYDTGEVVSSPARSRTLDFTVNNRAEHIQVRVKSDGLWSSWSSVLVNVSYTAPEVPFLSVTPQPSSGRNYAAVTNPAPGAGVPAVIENYLYRREQGEAIWVRIETGILPNGGYYDHTAASDTTYEYKARAVGDNGASADSAVVTASVLALVGAWLHDPQNTDTIHQFIYNDTGGDESWEDDMTLSEYAGRQFPFAEYGEFSRHSVSVEITAEVDSGDHAALVALLKSRRVLCYRDSYGRKLFFAPSGYNEKRRRWGARVPLNIVDTDYSEAV